MKKVTPIRDGLENRPFFCHKQVHFELISQEDCEKMIMKGKPTTSSDDPVTSTIIKSTHDILLTTITKLLTSGQLACRKRILITVIDC